MLCGIQYDHDDLHVRSRRAVGQQLIRMIISAQRTEVDDIQELRGMAMTLGILLGTCTDCSSTATVDCTVQFRMRMRKTSVTSVYVRTAYRYAHTIIMRANGVYTRAAVMLSQRRGCHWVGLSFCLR